MPYKEYYIEKVFYTISEVTEILEHFFGGTKVASSALRFWEIEFTPYINPIRRKKRCYTDSGELHFEQRERKYNLKDVDRLITITKLLFVEGYTLYGAKRQLYLYPKKYGLVKSPKFKKFKLQIYD